MRRFMRVRGISAIAGGLVAVVVAAGAAYAATSGVLSSAHTAASGRLYACVVPPFDTMNLSSAGAKCPDGQRKVSWNTAGSRGPRGLRGVAGGRGAAGPP